MKAKTDIAWIAKTFRSYRRKRMIQRAVTMWLVACGIGAIMLFVIALLHVSHLGTFTLIGLTTLAVTMAWIIERWAR